MKLPRLITALALTAVAGGVIYVVFGIYVHNTADATQKRAARHVMNGEPALARSDLKWLLWYEPDHPSALYLTGLSYLKEDNVPAAISWLERVPENSAFFKDARINLAAGLVADQQWERAESVLRGHISRYPSSLIGRRQLSGMLLTEVQQREAVLILTDVLRLPNSGDFPQSEIVTILLDLLIAEFSPPPAMVCLPTLEKVNNERPSQSTVRLAMGRCYAVAGRTEDARPLLQEALRQHPRDPRTRRICCEFLLDQGDADAAEAALLGSSGDSSPPADELEQDDRFWDLQCRIAELRGDYEPALKHIEQAIRMQPPNREYEARRARLLQRLQRTDDARAAYDRSHKLGKSELELWHLSRTLGAEDLNTTNCRHIAELYESLEKPLQAAAWRHLAEQIERQLMLSTR